MGRIGASPPVERGHLGGGFDAPSWTPLGARWSVLRPWRGAPRAVRGRFWAARAACPARGLVNRPSPEARPLRAQPRRGASAARRILGGEEGSERGMGKDGEWRQMGSRAPMEGGCAHPKERCTPHPSTGAIFRVSPAPYPPPRPECTTQAGGGRHRGSETQATWRKRESRRKERERGGPPGAEGPGVLDWPGPQKTGPAQPQASRGRRIRQNRRAKRTEAAVWAK